MNRRNRFLSIPCLAPILCFIIVVVPCAVYVIWQNGIISESQKKCEILLSEPVSTQDQSYFCQNGLVPASIGTCGSSNLQLKSRDVEQIIRANVTEGVTTYDEVSILFSDYEDYCQPPTELPTYTCRYTISNLWPPILINYKTATGLVESIEPLPCSSS